MRDYAELVKALRYCGDSDRQGCAKECRYGKEHPSNFRCIGFLFADAADAIEELQARNDKQTMMIRKQSERTKELLAAVPKWISVEERLPKKDEMVIVYYSWIGQSGTEYREVSLATLDEMRYCGSKLLGWMPLPKPPMEVE